MRRASSIILLLSACSYTPASPGEAPGVDGAPAIDASPTVDSSDPPPPIDAPPQQVTCTTSDSSLKLCLELEDPALGTARDGSGLGHDATVTGATMTTRDVPEVSQALGVAGGTTILVPATSDLDLQVVTVSAWVRRTGTPSGTNRFGVIDIGNRQAALAIDSQGRAVCFVRDSGAVWVGPGGTTAANEWDFVACTYDAPQLCTYVWRNGSATASKECGATDGDPLDLAGTIGTAIGALFDSNDNPASRLAGSIDSIRVYGRALSETELCTSAGISGC